MGGVFILLITVLALGLPLEATQCPAATLEEAKKSESALAQFSINIYKKIIADPNVKDKNTVMSPASIALALAMLESGADGATRQEIKNALVGVGSNLDVLQSYRSLYKQLKIDESDTKLTVANGMFLQQGMSVKPPFMTAIKECFESVIENKNFAQLEQVRQDINKWVSDKTYQKIAELFKPGVLQSDVILVLANAIYFKSSWLRSFTLMEQRGTFYKFGRESDTQSVPYMVTDRPLGYFSDDKLEAVELTYKNNDVSMFLIVPKARNGLANIENELTPEKFKAITAGVTSGRTRLRMPKFIVRTPVNLKNILSQMGLRSMFGGGLQRIADGPLYVSAVVHEAYINVNENGTEAAAATGIAVSSRSGGGRNVRIEHPFMYAIVHKPTNAIVFIGKVNFIDENAN